MRKLCFVLMPFGKKSLSDGRMIDFDAVYDTLIRPAVNRADLEPLRSDEEMSGGVIHKAMFERLVLCEYAVADLTLANANVFYELGIRHAVRPCTTQLVYAHGWGRLPFDVASLRAIPYELRPDGHPGDMTKDIQQLAERLKEAMKPTVDSPLFQILDEYLPPDISRLKTDLFRARVQYAEEVKNRLAEARRSGENAVSDVERSLGDLDRVDAAVIVDLFLSYRAVSAWKTMIDLYGRMPSHVAATPLVQEQYAFALNRNGRHERAEQVLKDLIQARGASSETYGLLGRVYKDGWEHALRDGKTATAEGFLDRAIEAYMKGFEADWRDAYPGINAVTLMEVKNSSDCRMKDLFPVVCYSNARRIEQGIGDYWDYATQLELAVLGRNEAQGREALSKALAYVREGWEPRTTVRNLAIIRRAREGRGNADSWAKEVEQTLESSVPDS